MPETFGAILLGGGGSSGAGVTSFNGRTGVVLPASGDYTPAEVGSPALSTLTAVGDLYVATGAGTVTRLAAGAAGTELLGNGAGVSPSYGVPPGRQLAIVQYAPTTLATYALTTSLATLDATNLTISFTVPANGQVLIEVDMWGFVQALTSEGLVAFGLFTHSTTTQRGFTTASTGFQVTATGATVASFNVMHRVRFLLTGLTAGPLQLDLAAGSNTTGLNVYSQGPTGAPSTSVAAPTIIRALAA